MFRRNNQGPPSTSPGDDGDDNRDGAGTAASISSAASMTAHDVSPSLSAATSGEAGAPTPPFDVSIPAAGDSSSYVDTSFSSGQVNLDSHTVHPTDSGDTLRSHAYHLLDPSSSMFFRRTAA